MPYPVGMAIEPDSKVVRAQAAGTSGQKPKCFVIAPIGEEGSPTRKRSNLVLKHIVGKSLEDSYDVQRADDIRQPGIVTVQIIEQLLGAPLVVADLSERNANVYYELAIRHAVKKPVVHLLTKGQEAPFDVSQMRYVSFDIEDPDSVEEAQGQLRDQVKNIESGEGVLTPIQFTQFMLTAQSGQTGNTDTGMIVKAVSAAMSNISEELKGLKELIARTPTVIRQNWPARNRSLSDLLGTPATTMTPEASIGVIAKAVARDAEHAKQMSSEETMRLAAEAAKLYEENEKRKK
jgi:hypothetical protein